MDIEQATRIRFSQRPASLLEANAGAYVRLLILPLLAGLLSACSTTSYNAYSAPPPPSAEYAALYQDISDEEKALRLSHYEAAAGSVSARKSLALNLDNGPSLGVSCSVKDRFDRKAALAYEWGDGKRNRLAMDIDGLSFSPFGGSSAKIENVTFKYRLKLQDWKNKKEKCRGDHNWQGLIGSSYRELVVREGDDTVWKKLNEIEDRIF